MLLQVIPGLYVIDRHRLSALSRRAATQLDQTQAIIYELSVQGFSMRKEAGFQHHQPSQPLRIS